MHRSVIIILFYFLPFLALPSDIIILSNDDVIPSVVDNYIETFEDVNSSFSIEDITSSKFNGFKKNSQVYPEGINKNTSSTYWIRYIIKAQKLDGQKWVIKYYNEHIDSLELFYQESNGRFRHQIAGYDIPYSFRTYKNIEPVFDLPSDTIEQYIYLKVKSSRTSGLSNKILPLNKFIELSLDRYMSESAFYGFLLFLLMSAFLLYLGSKEKIYLHYTIYVLAMAIFMIEKGALAFEYLWPEQPLYNNLLELIATPLLVTSLWLYTNSILEFFKVNVRNKWVNILMLSYLIYNLLFISIGDNDQVMIIFNVALNLGFLSFLFLRTLKYLWKIKQESYLFLIGIACIPISYSLHFIREIDLYNSSFITASFNYGLLIDSVLFSFALSHRFKKLKAEKEQNLKLHIEQLEENKIIRERVNSELEQLVKERTDELIEQKEKVEEVNEQLSQQAEIINQMNVQLDVQNHSLNKKVKQLSKARVLKESTPIDEFQNTFPDDRSCLLYMQEQKWGDHFKCRQCSYDQYVKGQKPFTRRCKKCHHQESVIFNTFLEGTRMKIKNAFMIIYLVIESEGKVSTYDLEKFTKTSRKSCGRLKTQIIEKLSELEEKSISPNIQNLLFS